MFFTQKFNDTAVYLDNAASSPLLEDLRNQLSDIWAYAYINPSSGHKHGQLLKRELDSAKAQFLDTLQFNDAELIWTSGGTESNNIAIKGLNCKKILSTKIDHPSIIKSVEDVAADCVFVNVLANGQLDLVDLEQKLDNTVDLLTVGLVNGETGNIQNLLDIRRLLDSKAPNCHFHVDAVQALTKTPIPWNEAKIDLCSFSAHKVHGPGAVGALVFRPSLEIDPLFSGGGQQNNIRSGSFDPAGILAFSYAVQSLMGNDQFIANARELNAALRERLADLKDSQGAPLKLVMISEPSASPFILAFSLPGFQAAVLMRILGESGVMISAGSACSAGSKAPSASLTAMGYSAEVAFGTLRASFGIQNSHADIERFIDALQAAVLAY